MKGYLPVNNYVYKFDDHPNDIQILNGWKNKGKIPGKNAKPLFQLKKDGFCALDNGEVLNIKRISLVRKHKYNIHVSGYLLNPENGKVGRRLYSFPLSRIQQSDWIKN